MTSASGELVRVAAAVLFRSDGRILLAQRPEGKPYAGYWEFPGGKLEAGETPQQALVREIREELGVQVTRAYPWLIKHFSYPHAHVELHFFRVTEWVGELQLLDRQQIAWMQPDKLEVAPVLPANTEILRALELPSIYGISMATELGEEIFLRCFQAALDRGLKLIQIREKALDRDALERLIAKMSDLAISYSAKLLLNGDAALARRLGLAGVHWTSMQLRAQEHRPKDLLVGASCHDQDELQRAAALDVDFVVLGPVLPTPSHAFAPALGWKHFAELAVHASQPVFAIGGLETRHLDDAMQCGAHGLALRRAAWSDDAGDTR